jgi:hypothetical protein
MTSYLSKTTFKYVSADGEEHETVYMSSGKVIDLNKNKTYSNINEWLSILPGSPDISKIIIKEPETNEKHTSKKRTKHMTFDDLCPNYYSALLLFIHEQYNFIDTMTLKNTLSKKCYTYAEDKDGNIVLIRYNRWNKTIYWNNTNNEMIEGTNFGTMGLKPDSNIYISNEYNRYLEDYGNQLTLYKAPFTFNNWKEYINKPIAFISTSYAYDEYDEYVNALEKECSDFTVIKIDDTNKSSIIHTCTSYPGSYQIYGKVIKIVFHSSYSNPNDILNTKYVTIQVCNYYDKKICLFKKLDDAVKYIKDMYNLFQEITL